MRTRWLAGLLLAFALGVGAGAIVARRPAPLAAAPERATVTRLVPLPGQSCSPGAPGIEEIRAALREELAAAQPPAAAPAVPDRVEAEGTATVTEGDRRLEAALSVGRWRNDDRLALMGLLPELSTDERDRVLQRLAAALNDGRLHLETDGPPI